MAEEERIFVVSAMCGISKVNAVRMKRYLRLNGYDVVENARDASVCIMTTCICLEESEDENFRRAAALLGQNPKLRMIFTGCGPRAIPELFAGKEAHPGYECVEELFPPRRVPYSKTDVGSSPDDLVGVSFSKSADDLLDDKKYFAIQKLMSRIGGRLAEKFRYYGLTEGVGLSDEDRYFVILSQGCNFRCSYCLIWKGTPRYYSFPKEQVFSQIDKGYSKGYRRFMLTYSDAASYGIDLYGRPMLKELLTEIFRRFPDAKFGLAYMSGIAFERAFEGADLRLYADHIFHLKLSIQSASERILKKMNRPADMKKLAGLLKEFRRFYDGIISAELMYGFPGETEEDIAETVEYIKDAGIDGFVKSKFSPRPGTPLENERPCGNAERHARLLEKAGNHLDVRYVRKVFSSFSEENFVRKRADLRFRKEAVPVEIAGILGRLEWGDWESEKDLVFVHPEFPDFSVTLRKGHRDVMEVGIDGSVFSTALRGGEVHHALKSLEDLFGRRPSVVSKRRRTATRDGIRFSVDKVRGLGDFLELSGEPGAVTGLVSFAGPELPPYWELAAACCEPGKRA